MKNINVNKITAVFLTLIMVFGLIPSMGFAQPNPASPVNEVKGFNMSVFDSHFSRADREINPERWLAEAKTGITQAVYAWELIAFGMYESPLLFEEAKAKLEDWSEKELEARFSKWLNKRFFGELAGRAVSEFSAMLEETQKKYTWRLDDEGNVIFDERTGDPLVIRPYDEGREFSADQIIWRSEADRLVEINSGNFDANLIKMYPEVLAYIPMALRETMSNAIKEVGMAVSAGIKLEFENIAAREQRIFTSRRTRDIWSLRKKSDDEAARIFTEQLIAETEQVCAIGINNLNTKIEQAYAGTGDLALIGEEWLNLYKEQFDRGLKAWEEAEERFFIRRLEWEQDSVKLFSEGEEIWLAAFEKINGEYQKWEIKAKELFDTGEQLFKDISNNLEKSIEDARKEFEINKNMRVGTGTEKVKALIDMYITGASAAITAKENLRYWLENYYGETYDPEGNLADLVRNAEDKNIQQYFNLYNSYMGIAADARGKILADYAELLGTGVLKDLFSPNASTDDFYLDEYQLALVRAKTLVLYWERKTAIARAVNDYSEKIDAGRMTEAESIQAWEKAKSDYNESLALYEAELINLNEKGEEVQSIKILLDGLAQIMSAKEEELNRLSREHSMLVARSYASIGDIVRTDFNSKYNFLAKEYKNFMKTGKDALYKDVLEYGMNWGIALQKEAAEENLAYLINEGKKDKSTLEGPESEVQLKTRLAMIDLFAESAANGADYQMRSVNSAYSGADWYAKAKGITLSKEEKAALYGEKLGERLYDDYNTSLLTLLKERLIYELEIFKEILNINSNADAMSKLKINGIRLTDIEYTYNVLSDLKKRLDSNKGIFTEDNDENDLIEYYIFEDTFCVNTEKELIDFYNDFNYCSNLLDVYCKYASVSSFGQKEDRQDFFNNINKFLSNYGLGAKEKYFPDARSIYEAILKGSGELTDNVTLFFYELQKCFSAAPKWLEDEFFTWKSAVLEYITADISTYKDELNSEKHWRQFLKEEFINKVDPVLTKVSTRKEGVIEDARFAADYYTNRLNDAFDLYSRTNFSAPTTTAQTLNNLYSFAFSDIDNRFYSLIYYSNEVSHLGRTLEISGLSQIEAENQRDNVYLKLIIQEGEYNHSRDDYFKEAKNFLDAGGLYDMQYKAVKKAYDDTENKRFEYEKEDAIRRWASTAYLGADSVNYDECKNKLEKAQVVLDVLMEINKNEKHVYNNPKYNALYAEYEQSFTNKIKVLDAFETVFSMLAQETRNNEIYFDNYQRALLSFGAVDSVNNINNWKYKNIIMVKDGKLAFSMDSSWIITDNSNSAVNNNFFNTLITPDGERYKISPFEEALRGLSKRMAEHLDNPDKLKQWSYAREYIISSLIGANPNLEYFQEYLAGLGELEKGRPLSGELYKPSVLSGTRTLYYYETKEKYLKDINYDNDNENEDDEEFEEKISQGQLFYMSLSEEKKADLEFYVILTLTGGGNGYISGFKEMLCLDLYQEVYDLVNRYYKRAANKNSKKYTIGIYNETEKINKNTLGRIESVLNDSKKAVNNYISGVNNDLLSIEKYGNSYLASCNIINILNEKKEAGQYILWDDINKALVTTKKFTSEDINIIKTSWEKMQKSSLLSFMSLYDALSGLVNWTKSEEARIRSDLEKVWLADAQDQKDNEGKYLSVVEKFISGTGNINTLKAAAEKAYGKNSILQINHLDNKHTVLINDFSMYLTMENNHYSEFASLGLELQSLTEKMLENRYDAELAAREIEWEQMQADILVKASEWQKSVSLVLGNGRTEWEAGKQRMNESYRQWYANFQSEMRRVENEWAQAYLAGLEDKDTWLEQAASAFNQASADSFLQLVGTEGERLSRFMDAREPFGVRNALPEAQAIMTNLLQSSGIVNMANALSSMSNISDTAAIKVRKGLGGVSSWDAAVVKKAAKDIAVNTNAEIADAEAKKLAHTARKTVNEAISGIYANVNEANRNFRESMDKQFIRDGLWRQNGTNYEKDIVKGSTLFQPVISQKKTVEGYRNYIMEPVSLETNMDEEFLKSLNSIAIRALIDNVYREINTIQKEIFGDSEKEISDGEDSEKTSGKFTVFIGSPPEVKPEKEFGSTKESFFYKEPEGELGRLMSEFIYWGVIDAKGSAELRLAPWDKRIWNDENSSFSAPTLRTVGQIAATVAVTIATGGTGLIGGGAVTFGNIATTALVSSSSNIFFGTLDAAFGYKSFGEAAFEIGKSYVTSFIGVAASVGIPAAGGPIGNSPTDSFWNIVGQTGVTGIKSATSSMASNVINSFTYLDGEFKWSKEIFASGLKDTMKGAVTAMAGTFTTQSLTAMNSGLNYEKIYDFDRTNVKNLNNLVGSLAGQGVNYAMGGDFTLNLLNLTLLTGNDEYNTGLLELHLGRNGTSMNLGTGGANVSIDNITSAFKGLQVLGVNNLINRFIKKQDDFGDDRQKGQLWDILNGEVLLMTDAEDEGIAKDIIAYSDGMDYFNSYVDGDYDSSADYFRMYIDKDEKVTKVLDDGDIYHATIVEADGSERTAALQGGSITADLASIAGNGMTREQMNDLIVKPGQWDEEGKAWYAKEDQGKYIPSEESVNNESGGLGASLTDLRGKVTGLVNYAKDTVFSLVGKIKNKAGDIISGINNLLGFNPKPLTPDIQADINGYLSVPGGKGNSIDFFNEIMNKEIAAEYSYDNKKTYQCNEYFRNVISKNFGAEVYNMIFEGKNENTNAMFDSFKNNQNLQRLDPAVYSIKAIQDLADSGTLVFMIYKNTIINPNTEKPYDGHIAFVGNSNLTLYTVPSIPDLQNTSGKNLIKKDQLVLVQAGVKTGVTSIIWGTNGWNADREKLLNNYLYFYTVKRN